MPNILNINIKMDTRSQETLRKIEQNDAALKELRIGSYVVHIYDDAFYSSESEDYSRLGAAIGKNNHLTKLVIDDDVDNGGLTVTNGNSLMASNKTLQSVN